jgi:heme/copper-type cytochrome/quinol oxidase subunit 3
MNTIKRTIAATEFLLVFPGALFMAALIVRSLQPTQYEPAHTAQRLVEWYSARLILGLYVFLIALPFAALVIGCATVLRSWRSDAGFRRATLETLAAVRTHLATLLISGATLVAGGILAIVAVHMITDS